MGKGVFARPLDTSLVLVLDARLEVGGWDGGGLCVLLAIDCMHLAGSHVTTCNEMHYCAKYCTAVHCIVLIWMTLHCIALI